MDNAALDCVGRADAVCFGTLAQRSEPSRQTVRTLVKRAKPRALKVLDINLRQHYYSKNVLDASLRLANVLKINDDELSDGGGTSRSRSRDPRAINCANWPTCTSCPP